MSSKGNEKRAALIERELRRPIRLMSVIRFLLMIALVAGAVVTLAGCAQEASELVPLASKPAASKIVYRTGKERTITEPATDKQIALIIVEASRAAYLASGRNCPCPDDHYSNGRICGGNSAGSLPGRSEEHTSELQSPALISYAVFCLSL